MKYTKWTSFDDIHITFCGSCLATFQITSWISQFYPSAGHFVINLDFFFMHTVHREHITFLWQNTLNSWWSLERAFNAFNSVRNIVYAENLFDRFSKLVHRHRMIWFISNWALDHFIRIFVCITHQHSFFFSKLILWLIQKNWIF